MSAISNKMHRAISYQGFLPLRSEPSHKAEMISQLLFGESLPIIKTEGQWILLENGRTHSQAWVDKTSSHISKDDKWMDMEPQAKSLILTLPYDQIEDTRFSRKLLLPAGSVLICGSHAGDLPDEARFKKDTEAGWIEADSKTDPEEVGRRLISIPGIYGGRCGFGFDAAGLIQFLCKTMGLDLPHSIEGQSIPGSPVNFLHEAQKGDLAFFHKGDDELDHVGMVLEHGKIIHASDQVRIDRLDQQGIYCEEKEGYTHQLRIIKSIKI